jgi:hypothetical protein
MFHVSFVPLLEAVSHEFLVIQKAVLVHVVDFVKQAIELHESGPIVVILDIGAIGNGIHSAVNRHILSPDKEHGSDELLVVT